MNAASYAKNRTILPQTGLYVSQTHIEMAERRWRFPLYASVKPLKYVVVDENTFKTLRNHRWRLHRNGYVYTWINGRSLFLHAMVIRCPKGKIIDHINRQPLDCRRSNLRIVNKHQSAWNKGPYRNNTSGYKGVYFDKYHSRWSAQIAYKGKRKSLGRFSTATAAAKAYDRAARKLHGIYAYLNFADVSTRSRSSS